MLTSNDSDKRERNIKTKRLPNKVHTKLCRFRSRHNYETMFGALVAAADKFMTIDETGGYVAITVAHESTPEAKR
jgi:hypothetical protein